MLTRLLFWPVRIKHVNRLLQRLGFSKHRKVSRTDAHTCENTKRPTSTNYGFLIQPHSSLTCPGTVVSGLFRISIVIKTLFLLFRITKSAAIDSDNPIHKLDKNIVKRNKIIYFGENDRHRLSGKQ